MDHGPPYLKCRGIAAETARAHVKYGLAKARQYMLKLGSSGG